MLCTLYDRSLKRCPSPMSSGGGGEGGGIVSVMNEIECKQRLTQKLLAVPPHPHTRPPGRPSLCSIMPPCASTPRPHKNMSPVIQNQASMGHFFVCLFCCFFFPPRLDYSPTFDPHDFVRDAVGIFFCSSCQQNIKSLHTHIEIIGIFNLRTHWMNGAF